MSEYIKPKVQLLDKPPRLVVEFKGGITFEKGKFMNFSKLTSSRIKKIRISASRVVLDLNKRVDYEEATFYGKNQTVIEIRDTNRPSIYEAPSLRAIHESPLDVAPPPEIKVKKVAPQVVKVEKVEKEEKAIPPKRGKILVVKKPSIFKGKVIVVDPGHGGADPGAFGLYGIVEKSLTLKTAYKLVDFLKQSGATVYLTRKRNVKIDLAEVVAFANRIKADVYIGIHYNAAYNSSINGTETYYYQPGSAKLAQKIHREIVKKLGRPDRLVRRAKLYTVHHTKMPAVIVEPVFVTNPDEARLLQNESFLKNVAWGITAGLKDYFKK